MMVLQLQGMRVRLMELSVKLIEIIPLYFLQCFVLFGHLVTERVHHNHFILIINRAILMLQKQR